MRRPSSSRRGPDAVRNRSSLPATRLSAAEAFVAGRESVENGNQNTEERSELLHVAVARKQGLLSKDADCLKCLLLAAWMRSQAAELQSLYCWWRRGFALGR
jgi:hypothetical protein